MFVRNSLTFLTTFYYMIKKKNTLENYCTFNIDQQEFKIDDYLFDIYLVIKN